LSPLTDADRLNIVQAHEGPVIMCKFQPLELFLKATPAEGLDEHLNISLNIVTCRGLRVTYRRGLDWMVEFTGTLFTQHGTTGSTAVSLIYTLYSSPLHTY
jgi:hypothetical protein